VLRREVAYLEGRAAAEVELALNARSPVSAREHYRMSRAYSVSAKALRALSANGSHQVQ
jgi:hypothetical protein